MTYTDFHDTPEGPRLVEAVAYHTGVDWFSATIQSTDSLQAGWYSRACMILAQLHGEGERVEPRTIYGYSGIGAGGSFVGDNGNAYMLILSGERADRYWRELYRKDMHVSRLDLQLTVIFSKEVTDIVRRAYEDAVNHNEKLPDARRRRIYEVLGSDGGHTIYVGAPSSENRLCLYNKAKQSKDTRYSNAWRYEYRTRNDRATAYSYGLHRETDGYTGAIVSIVAAEYASRGITVPYNGDREAMVLQRPKPLVSEAEHKLQWLNKQVRPTVQWLVELGRLDDVMRALGLMPS